MPRDMSPDHALALAIDRLNLPGVSVEDWVEQYRAAAHEARIFAGQDDSKDAPESFEAFQDRQQRLEQQLDDRDHYS